MRTDRALDIVKSITYKPNWSFEARPAYLNDGQLVMTVHYRVPNSDVSLAPAYKEMVPAKMEWFIDHGDLAEDDVDKLARRVFRAIHEIEDHEMREFFAYAKDDEKYYKPYHPHTNYGPDNWAADEGLDHLKSPLADHRFGWTGVVHDRK